MEPFFLGYLLLPLGYTTALAAVSANAERALSRGNPEKAIKLLKMARKAPFLSTFRSMCEVNLITAAYAIENFELVEEMWGHLQPKLEGLRPYAGSALASYGATLIGRGHYLEAENWLRSPVQEPKPDQRADDVTVLCMSFCQANLSSALINLGHIEEAQELLEKLHSEGPKSPLLSSLVNFLIAYVYYLNGDLEQSRAKAAKLKFRDLPRLYRTELRCHYATLLARCEDQAWAQRIIEEIDWDCSSNPKLTRLRTLAKAEIASVRGETQLALSYFKDLRALGHRSALAYLRAAALAKRCSLKEEETKFLRAAVDLDPQSHWAQIAQKKSTPRER